MFKILLIGKNKEDWLTEALAEYNKRLNHSIQFIFAKDDAQLIALCKKEKHVICLDPAGKEMDSVEFSKWLYQRAGVSFVIGGAEGLPPELKEYPLISLSKMTMTHQIVRLVLVEQIYRASEIFKGTPYHK